MEKEKLKQIKKEEREKTRTSRLENKYGNRSLKRLAEKCGYEFVYRAWLEAQRQERTDLACSFIFLILGLAGAVFTVFGVGNYSYFIFYVAAYYFLSSVRSDSIRADQYFDRIINASRAHSIQGEIEAFIHLNEEIENENAKS